MSTCLTHNFSQAFALGEAVEQTQLARTPSRPTHNVRTAAIYSLYLFRTRAFSTAVGVESAANRYRAQHVAARFATLKQVSLYSASTRRQRSCRSLSTVGSYRHILASQRPGGTHLGVQRTASGRHSFPVPKCCAALSNIIVY